MYFNDVHILIYVAIAAIGFVVGSFVNWMNYRFLNEKKILCKELFQKKTDYKSNIILSIIVSVLYVFLLYKFGIGKTFLNNLNLIKCLILTPMILSAFIIDYK